MNTNDMMTKYSDKYSDIYETLVQMVDVDPDKVQLEEEWYKIFNMISGEQ